MAIYVYRKVDLHRVADMDDIYELETVFENSIKPNYGGELTDYGVIEVDYPKFKLEWNEETNEVIVVEIVEVINLDDYKTQKILELKNECSRQIQFEFYSDCEDELKRYPNEQHDQLNVMGITITLQPNQATVLWKSADEIKCREFSTLNFLQLGTDMKSHITNKRLATEDSVLAILSATTVEEVDLAVENTNW